jgi:hypothetical protein
MVRRLSLCAKVICLVRRCGCGSEVAVGDEKGCMGYLSEAPFYLQTKLIY